MNSQEFKTNKTREKNPWNFINDLEIPFSGRAKIIGSYYQREIANAIGKYQTRIFAFFPESEQQLKDAWEAVDSWLGVHYLSEVKSEIERSNFYTCYFCKENIFPALRMQMEKDPYFTKKYVFEGQEWLNADSADDRKSHAVSEMEKRIFHLHIPASSELTMSSDLTKSSDQMESSVPSLPVPKVKELSISNFRAFEGDFAIDFSDQAGNPASFSLIYAPNGTGKTSLIDAVEYALKGEVPRLKGQQKISGASGCIYRNYNAESKANAEVRICFDNQESLSRSVGSIGKTGHDIRSIQLKGKGAEIAGTKRSGQKDNWDRLILPYDRIDSFLTAKTPEQKYKEWCKSDPTLKEERAAFEKRHKEKRDTELAIQKTDKTIEDLSHKLGEMRENKSGADEIITLISRYNRQAAEEDHKLLPLTQASKISDYRHLLDAISRLLREIERDEKELVRQEEELSSFLMHYTEAQELYTRYEQRKGLQQKENAVRKKILNLQNENTEQNEKLKAIRNQAKIYLMDHTRQCTCPVCNAGYDSWNALLSRIDQADNLSQDLYQERLRTLQEQLQSLEKQRQDLDQLIAENSPESEKTFSGGYRLYKEYSREELEEMGLRMQEQIKQLQSKSNLLLTIRENHSAHDYFAEYQQTQLELKEAEVKLEKQNAQLKEKEIDFEEARDHLEDALQKNFSSSFMNEIYGKINPHETMRSMHFDLDFNAKDEPKLYITMDSSDSEKTPVNMPQSYLPEMYFSISQLNTVAFSSFFSRALETTDMYMKTIFIDDPVGNFDDMNVLGFVDMIRCIIENTDCQIIMTTHDDSVYDMFRRKLDSRYHSTCFRTLPAGEGIRWEKKTT